MSWNDGLLFLARFQFHSTFIQIRLSIIAADDLYVPWTRVHGRTFTDRLAIHFSARLVIHAILGRTQTYVFERYMLKLLHQLI